VWGARGSVGRGPARESAVGLLLVAEQEGHVSGRRGHPTRAGGRENWPVHSSSQ
jgi:hypothetical protein